MTVACEQQDAWRAVDLFGGAMRAQLPERFQDLSDVRDVPDHQEVWSDPHADQSVVVEIAELSQQVADADIGRFAFDDLAAANEASSSSITGVRQLGADEVPHMPQGTHMALVTGTLVVAKGRDAAEQSNSVLLLLTVLRLRQHSTDLLVSVNAPLFVSEGSSAGLAAGSRPAAQAQAAAVMRGVLGSLRVEDWGLFGGSGEGEAAGGNGSGDW